MAPSTSIWTRLQTKSGSIKKEILPQKITIAELKTFHVNGYQDSDLETGPKN